MKALSTNKLASSPHYTRIIHEYNTLLERKGKVNNLKFHREVILPVLPNYHVQSWYQYLRRFKSTTGLMATEITRQAPNTISSEEERKLEQHMLTNQIATQLGIQRALNVGADALQMLIEHPELLSVKERADILFKAMKAQDSRIHAVGKIREDSRQEEKFERAFGEAAYGDR